MDTTSSDTLTITCHGYVEPFIIKIKNQGIIHLKQDYRAYANDIILNPTREIKSNELIKLDNMHELAYSFRRRGNYDKQ